MSDSVNVLLRFHRPGMNRVCSVIDGNPDYDALMAYRIEGSEWAPFADGIDVADKRQAALETFESKIRRGSLKVIKPTFPGFCCEGRTNNNLREFAFFERLCASSGIRLFNYSDCATETVVLSDGQLNDAVEILIDDAKQFYAERSDISASVVYQQILYSRSLLAYALAFSSPDAVRPAALVQANDHSPVRVAMSMVMKALGVPRVYLQHAEVTRYFPELDFEYSVLRNRQSLSIYQEVGPVSGKVYVIPRQEDPFAREALSKRRTEGVAVVIYPTSRVLVPELCTLARILSDNVAVGSVSIKPHPGAPAIDLEALTPTRVRIVTEVPHEDHIAIVGNSAVAIELIHRGIPVYQCFTFDPIAPDYYGFVRSGLTKQVTLDDLSRPFWEPYDLNQQWLETYAAWDPSVDGRYLKDKAEFVAEMARLAGQAAASGPLGLTLNRFVSMRARLRRRAVHLLGRMIRAKPALALRLGGPAIALSSRVAEAALAQCDRAGRFLSAHVGVVVPVSSGPRGPVPRGPRFLRAEEDVTAFLVHALPNTEDPGTWMQLNDRAEIIPAATIIKVLDTLFQQRSPALNTILGRIKGWPSGSASGTWAYLKKVSWGNLEIGETELADIARFVYGYTGTHRVRASLEQSLLLAILRAGTCEQLDEFWRKAVATTRATLSTNHQIEIIRKLRATPGREEEAASAFAKFTAQASPFDRLKFKTMDVLEGRGVAGWDHSQAEGDFIECAPPPLSTEFANHVRPTYERLRSRMRFMDVRFDREAACALNASIRDALTRRQPFCLIRLSDGEGYLFPDGPFFGHADSANRERHWWGIELNPDRRARIIEQARQAIRAANVVGIPTVYRFIRDHSIRSASLAQTVQGRGLLQVLHGVPGLIGAHAVIGEDKLNVSLFSDMQAVCALADAAAEVVVVGSVRGDHLPSPLRSLSRLQCIELPTHARTALNDKYNAGAMPLPLVYDAIVDRMDDVVGPGTLVLVAGGIVGKILLGRAHERGAVALDIGSVLDDWTTDGLRTMR
jgi:hypothetical protein